MYSTFIQGKKLSELSTFGIGGPARYFIEVKDIPSLQEILQFCFKEKLPYLPVGKGSNCLFSDSGFDGLVILNKIDFYKEIEPLHIYVGAGFSFSLLGMQTAKKGWSGLEFAAGIPATVGGAVFMNAGAQGQDTQSALTEVEYVDEEGKLHLFKKEELEFAYRKSSFQKMKGVIASARFCLTHDTEAKAKQRKLLDYRICTQPYNEKSAGCVFRNPENASAGALIDKCGLKGFAVGGAKVSEMHANFLINSACATSQDMIALITHVKAKVKEQHGVDLETEIRVIHE